MHGFTDEERDRIREQLVETGHELLLTLGPEKTNVADVTEPVGIAKSTFYRFFDSKAELYFEIFLRESEAFRDEVKAELAETDDPLESLERLFRCYAAFAEENPLVQRVTVKGEYRDLFRGIPQQSYEQAQRAALTDFLPFVEEVQNRSDGPIADLAPETILGVMGTIGLFVLHREEYDAYDEQYYQQVKEAFITSLARGLVNE
ncbi:TetR/AcrR family transcriptional regulator [Halegenticoccus tardaugens]|uniref:TetR/AcrR family transcriptional regulator n=1 Tax=Halegenticoccus tardaugens TaxID=2071624 RepID=UPI00100B0871|nr:TetR/AcrR family transcriptional regulator [Halegenticoccus tardaugens]